MAFQGASRGQKQAPTLALAQVGGVFEAGRGSTCEACKGRGRERCLPCESTGLSNSWLWQPSNEDGGWGARGE